MGLFIWPEISEPALVAVAYKQREQADLIGTQLLPRKKVGKDEFKLKDVDDTVGGYPTREKSEDADPDRYSHGYTEATKTAKSYREEEKVTRKSVEQADAPFDPFNDATKHLAGRQTLGEEVRIMTALTDTGVITQTAAAANAWSDTTNGTPEADIRTAIQTIWQNSGSKPDFLLIGVQTMTNLAKHPDVKDIAKYTSAELLISGMLPKTLWGLEVFIAAAAKKNEITGAFTQVLSNVATIGRRKEHAGYMSGNTFFSEDFQITLGKPSDDNRYRKVYSSYTYLPVVHVPPRYYVITAVDS